MSTNARRPWSPSRRWLVALFFAAGVLALPAPGQAHALVTIDTAVASGDSESPLPPDLPAPDVLPETTAADLSDAAPSPGALYLLALMVVGLLGGYRRAQS